MRLQGICLKGIIAVLVSLPLICNSLVFAERWTVESLQKEIDARGYKWKAGKTALSDLSLEELQTMFPLKLPNTMRMMAEEERMILPDDFPTFLDWRNYKVGNWITPVKNQFPCGTCVIFATVGVMETLIKLHYNDPDLPVDLAEQYASSCGPGCGAVELPDIAIDFMLESGVPDESCFPYQAIQLPGMEPPCSKTCSDSASRIHKLSSYSYIGGEGMNKAMPYSEDIVFIPYPENIKAVLINKPAACGILVGMDFRFYTGGIYEPTSLAPFGHFVEIIGFDDEQQCWICKNSWGTNWGETADFEPYTPGAGDGGYFRVSYVTTEDTKTYFGVFTADMNYDGGPPVLPPTSTTTTTISCPSSLIYGTDSAETELLRSIRDNVLSKSHEGRELIKLYYLWSPVIVRAMEADEDFKEDVKDLVDEIMGMVE